jgi:hypothetical protein
VIKLVDNRLSIENDIHEINAIELPEDIAYELKNLIDGYDDMASAIKQMRQLFDA